MRSSTPTPEVGDAQVFLDAVVHDDVVTITVRGSRAVATTSSTDNPERDAASTS